MIALIRGELDWIVIKCLEKERSRRYETANGLAMDLQRYLANEPVVAGPPSATYRLRKFVRRNRGSLLVAGALIATLIVGGGALLAIRAEASRNRAAREARATAAAAAAAAPPASGLARPGSSPRTPLACNSRPTPPSPSSAGPTNPSLANHSPMLARVDLTAARQDVEDLARHTRLLVAGTANLWQFADDLNGQNVRRAEADFCTRQREAFAQFGLDPLAEPAEEAARTVAASRLRDPLLGFLLEWQLHADDPGTKNRLGQVVGAARRLSGGAYARWQDLLDRKDVTGLVAFATSPDGLAFPASLVGALGRDLSAARQFPACLTYLRAATDRYPHDPWLHFDLSDTCREIEPAGTPRGPAAHGGGMRAEARKRLVSPPARRLLLEPTGVRSGSVSPTSNRSRSTPIRALHTKAWGSPWRRRRTKRGRSRRSRNLLRLRPNNPQAILSYAMGLIALGRPAEAVRTIVDALGRFPSWADDPRLYLRYNAACAAMICADGKGSPPVSLAERQTFRKQALDLLAADLAALAKLAASDREFVHKALRHWLADGDLEGVRPPRTADLPPEERNGWEELWARVNSLKAATASSRGPSLNAP